MMMKDDNVEISITGMVGKRNEKAMLDAAARFFAEQLMDPRMVRNLKINIEVRKGIDIDGECVNEDGIRNPRWFTIGLKYQDINEMIKTLGLSLIHI